MPSWRGSRAVVGGLTVVLVAGCAGVPTSGPVHVGPPISNNLELGEDFIGQIPPAPVAGSSAGTVLYGFLIAQVDGDENFKVARSFLATGAVWNASTSTTLVDSSSLVVKPVSGNKSESPLETQLEVTADRIGIVDARGDYRTDPGPVRSRFTLIRQDGQWRISHPAAGLILSASDAERSLQPASIYFLNRSSTRVVPQPMLLPPDEPGLATILIKQLLLGPSTELAPAVVTAVPHGTALQGTVPIDSDGVAEVNLSVNVQPISQPALARLAAQIVWTLQQIPSVTAVRLLDNGAPLTAPGVLPTMQTGSFSQYDPDSTPTPRGALLSDAGHVVGLGITVPGPLTRKGIRSPLLAGQGTLLAGLLGPGPAGTLVEGSLAGPLRSPLPDDTVTSPTFDPDGNLFVVRGTGAAAQVVEVPSAGRARVVPVPASVRKAGIDAIAVSPDGSRLAMVVGPPQSASLMVGSLGVVRNGPAVVGVWLVLPASNRVSGLTWVGSANLATTVRLTKTRREVEEASVDGYRLRPLVTNGLPGTPTQVSAGPGQPMLAAAAGAVYAFSGNAWLRQATGVDPSYVS